MFLWVVLCFGLPQILHLQKQLEEPFIVRSALEKALTNWPISHDPTNKNSTTEFVFVFFFSPLYITFRLPGYSIPILWEDKIFSFIFGRAWASAATGLLLHSEFGRHLRARAWSMNLFRWRCPSPNFQISRSEGNVHDKFSLSFTCLDPNSNDVIDYLSVAL